MVCIFCMSSGAIQSHLRSWLTVIPVVPAQFGAAREEIRLALEAENIESRPLWKLMHRPPTPQSWGERSLPLSPRIGGRGGAVAEALFRDGLCLPSGTAMNAADQQRVSEVI